MTTRNRSAFAVLGFLTWGPMSGYDIRKCVEGSTANFWAESYGQIYPVLRRLADDGHVRAQGSQSSQGGGRRERVVYEITDAGQQELDDWLRREVQPSPPRNELLLKLFFGRHLTSEARRRHIEEHRARQDRALERYALLEAELREAHAHNPDLPYWLLTLRYGRRETSAHIEWCDEALAELAAFEDEQ